MSEERILQVPLDKIDLVPQVRKVFDEALIKGLAASLLEFGLLEPVSLLRAGDRFFPEDGDRRIRAAKLAGWETIAARISAKELSSLELLLRQCVRDFQRVDFTSIEKARATERLMRESGWKANEVAAKLGVSCPTISRLLALLKLPEPIQDALKSGKIPSSAGAELAKIEDPELQAELAKQLSDRRLTRDGVTGSRKAAKRRSLSQPSARQKKITALLSGGRSVTVCNPGETLEDFISLLEELLGRARKGRTQGLGLDTLMRLLRDQASIS